MDTGPDAESRYPTAAAIENNPEVPSPGTISKAVDVLDVIRQRGTSVEDNSLITIHQVNVTCRSDRVYQKPAKDIINGFPKTSSVTDPEIREYWEVHNYRLSYFRDIVLLDDRIVKPQALRKQILQSLLQKNKPMCLLA